MAATLEILQSRPAGDVANAYEQSRARVATILGPVGGGKTIASSKRVIRVARWQDASPRDGIRRARICCLARTYPDLWDKVLPSYKKTYPEKIFGKVEGTKNRQADHHYRVRDPIVGGILDVEVMFRAVQDVDLEDFVRGLEVTAWWLTEMDTLPQAVVELAAQRVGRYPEPDDRPPPLPGETERELAFRGVFGDANVPDIDDWFYEQFWLSANRPAHWHLFLQPPGVLPEGNKKWKANPAAENLENLRKIDPNYYVSAMADMQAWQIRRFLQCKPGYSRHATPVHEWFDEVDHVSAGPLEVDPYKPVIIGADGGANTLFPSAAFMQNPRPLTWRVYDEFAPQTRCSVEELAQNIMRVMNTRIRRSAGAVIIGDPAMNQALAFGGNGGQTITTYAQKLQDLTGIEVQLAPSQKPGERRGALQKVGERRGGLLIDPRVVRLIRALAGGFRYRKQTGGKVEAVPEKNVHSHIAEGCEYGVLGGEGLTGWFGSFGDNSDAATDLAALMPQPIM